MEVDIVSASVTSPTRRIGNSPDVATAIVLFVALAKKGDAELCLNLKDGNSVIVEGDENVFSLKTAT